MFKPLFFCFLLATGCSPPSPASNIPASQPVAAAERENFLPAARSNSTQFTHAGTFTGTVSGGWAPSSVTLTCATMYCPAAVGALIWVFPQVGRDIPLKRCTAFLIDADRIMTSGHCDFMDSSDGYFFTRTDLPNPQVMKIGRLLFKVYTRGPKDGEVSGRPDLAVFELANPISGIESLPLAKGAPDKYSSLTAYVVNADPSTDATKSVLRIDMRVCQVHHNGVTFPYDVSENPDILMAFDCACEAGNSGSPLFGNGGTVVEAVLQGADELSAAQLASEQPPLAHHSISATNLRCVGYPAPPAKPCPVVTEESINARYSELVEQAFDGLKKRAVPEANKYPTQFHAIPFQLVTPKGSLNLDAEVFYYPSCRLTTPRDLLIPIEHVQIDFDQWGSPQLESLGVEDSAGALSAVDQSIYNVQMNWTAPFGKFLNPNSDPRLQKGSRFSIALPPCSP